MDRIKTTHVGSLPRSNELSDFLFKKDKQEKIDVNNFDEIVKRDVKKIVKKQINFIRMMMNIWMLYLIL